MKSTSPVKRSFPSVVIFLFCATAVGVSSMHGAFAQMAKSPLQKELTTMRTAYDKAVTATLSPLNKSYVMALEKLSSRAALQKDDAGVAAIGAEITRVREQLQADASLQAAIVGSRWKWYSSSNLTGEGKAFIDFYRDGVARTSWGTRVRYAIQPPASLRVSQDNPKQDWFFAVDLSKKQALADPFFSEGHEKRSLSWDRSVPPVEPKTPPKPAY